MKPLTLLFLYANVLSILKFTKEPITMTLKINTLDEKDLYNTALYLVKAFTSRNDTSALLSHNTFGGHYTIEDLASDAVEKILKAKPTYLTFSYVKIAVKCTCISKINKKNITCVSLPFRSDESEPEYLKAHGENISNKFQQSKNAYDSCSSIEEKILKKLTTEEYLLYSTLSFPTAEEAAEFLGISYRTWARKMAALRKRIEYIIENDRELEIEQILREEEYDTDNLVEYLMK